MSPLAQRETMKKGAGLFKNLGTVPSRAPRACLGQSRFLEFSREAELGLKARCAGPFKNCCFVASDEGGVAPGVALHDVLVLQTK
jgi:hypothetical protein